jgi:hypothetical protein
MFQNRITTEMSLFSHIADDSFSSWFAARTNRDRDTVLNVNNNASDGNGPSVGEGMSLLEKSSSREANIEFFRSIYM